MACWMIQSSCWAAMAESDSRQESLTAKDMANLQTVRSEGTRPGRASPPGERTRCIHHRGSGDRSPRMRGEQGCGQRSGLRRSLEDRATWACRRRRRQAFPMWVAAGSPAASMSMADSKASPSIGPHQQDRLPVSRSCSRSDGVAVTPLFVASAVWVRIAASGRSLAMHCSMAGVRAGWRRSSGKPLAVAVCGT